MRKKTHWVTHSLYRNRKILTLKQILSEDLAEAISSDPKDEIPLKYELPINLPENILKNKNVLDLTAKENLTR